MPTVTPRARALLARGDVLLIGHRGACALAPENTVPSFRLASEAGADLVELDTRETSDGVPIVLHDKTLDRTTDAVSRWGGKDLAVAQRPLAALRTLDAGTWFSSDCADARVPTLEEALAVIQPSSMTLIERKTGGPAPILALLRRRGWVDRVVVQSFDWDFVAAMRAAHPSIVLGALGSKALPEERLERLVASGADVVAWRETDVDEEFVARVRAHGLPLWVWTVDDPDRAKVLVAMGVRGVITNDPGALRRALAR